MCLIENVELIYKQSSNPDTVFEGLVLLNNGFYYSVTIFETFIDWKEIEVLEDQYTNEQLEAMENELLCLFKNDCIYQQ